MRKIEIWNDIDIPLIKSHPDLIFVVSDNFLKTTISKELENVLPLRVKKGPSSKVAAYYTDSDLIFFQKILSQDLAKIKIQLLQGKTIILSKFGYGNTEKIGDFSKNLKAYLDDFLRDNLQFNNITGEKFVRVPSYSEISAAKECFFNSLASNSLPESHLIDLIIKQKKLGLTFTDPLEINTLIKLISTTSKDVIVCKIIDCYRCDIIQPSDWSVIECSDISKYDINMYQSAIEFVCSVNPNGNMKFNNSIFSVPNKPKPENVENKNQNQNMNEKITNEQLFDLLSNIEKKLDLILESRKPDKKKLFSKKSIDELLLERGIIGQIKSIESNKYEVTTEDKIYFIELKNGLVFNKINILLTKNKN